MQRFAIFTFLTDLHKHNKFYFSSCTCYLSASTMYSKKASMIFMCFGVLSTVLCSYLHKQAVKYALWWWESNPCPLECIVSSCIFQVTIHVQWVSKLWVQLILNCYLSFYTTLPPCITTQIFFSCYIVLVLSVWNLFFEISCTLFLSMFFRAVPHEKW